MTMNLQHIEMPFRTNCFVLNCEETLEAIVIDPGAYAAAILEYIDSNGLKLMYIVATHGHADHVGAVSEIKRAKGVPFYLHEKEGIVLESFPDGARRFNFSDKNPPEVDAWLDVQQTYRFGNCSFKVLETPGHSPGGVCFLFDEYVFVGDTLFRGGIAPTDIPGSDHELLLKSIRSQLYTLDENLVVFTGHGAVTTIGLEKMSNPFVNEPGAGLPGIIK
jgi:glyoxylase-like metal-dependent hydrolase (beta-lactamase superfamily II)